MAHVTKYKSGKKFVHLNPAEKGKRYGRQLKSGISGKGNFLTEHERQYRHGYLDARQDNADAYNYNKAKQNGTLKEYWEKRRKRDAERRSRSKKSN